MPEQVSSLKTGIKYKNTPIGKIPVDWELVRLGDICSISSGGASNYSKDVNEKTYPVYGSNGILGSYDELNFSDGLVIGRVGASGSIHMISSPVWASDNTLLLSITDRFAQKLFIYYYLQKCNLPGLATKTAQPLLTQQILKSVLIAKPNIYEQKKIAEILTTVDEAIEKTAQIIEKTKEVKKGLMQKLLTRGIGHKKFKKTVIGEIPEEWEVVKLKDVAASQKYSFVDGPFGSNLKSIHYTKQGIPVIQSQSIISGVFKPAEEFYVSEQKARELERSKVLPGDIVIAKIGVNYGASGTIPKNYPPAVLSGNTMKITPDPDKVATEFLQHLLHYFRTIKVFDKIVSTTAQPAITLEGTRKIMIPLPPLPEQKQIAAILSSVDDEIEKESNSKKELEAVKKGLMQMLLTGKIRVKI